MADGIITSCNVACGSKIMTVNSPSGSTMQCDTWNSTSGFDFDRITAVDMSFCTSLRNFIQIV